MPGLSFVIKESASLGPAGGEGMWGGGGEGPWLSGSASGIGVLKEPRASLACWIILFVFSSSRRAAMFGVLISGQALAEQLIS